MKNKQDVVVLFPQHFFGLDDEALLFNTLDSFSFVIAYWGLLSDFFVKVPRKLDDDDFYRLYALMGRYGCDLEQVRVFIDNNNKPFWGDRTTFNRVELVRHEKKSFKEINEMIERNRQSESKSRVISRL